MGRHVTIGSDRGTVSVLRDGAAPRRVEPVPGFEIEELWRGPASGPEVLSAPPAFEFAPEPEVGSAAFRMVTFPPGLEPQLHRTSTTDLVAVVDGEPTLVLDGGDELTLHRGDTVVQCGAVHGWKNVAQRPATIAVLLLSARAH